MKRLIVLVIFFAPMIMSAQDNEGQPATRLFQVSMFYPVGTAGTSSIDYANHLSLNLTYGVNGGVKGLEVGGVGNFNRGSVEGIQLGGVLNINTRASSGILLAGVGNMNSEGVDGAQAAGVYNLNVGPSRGLMLSGVFNGSQQVRGMQMAGVANVAAGDVKGVQLAGVYNSARAVKGLQVAGLANIATTVKGLQFAPLLNIADTSDYAISLINLVKSGEKSLSLSTDETSTVLVSFRSGGRVLYSILGVGYNFLYDDTHYAAEGGFGVNLLNRYNQAGEERLVRLRAEAVVMNLTDFKEDKPYFRSTLRVLPALRKGNFELFAGPTFNYVNLDKAKSSELNHKYLWNETNASRKNGLYIGAFGGLSYVF